MPRSDDKKAGKLEPGTGVMERENRRVTRPLGRVEHVFRRIVEVRNKPSFEPIPVEV
jgi:hypothetical protein